MGEKLIVIDIIVNFFNKTTSFNFWTWSEMYIERRYIKNNEKSIFNT